MEVKEHPSSGEYLHSLEESGEFLFHGSREKIETLEPRQSTNYDPKQRKQVPHGEPAVSATPFSEIAIFRALISLSRDRERGACGTHHGAFGLDIDDEPYFEADSNSLENAKRPETKGYVFVFKRNDFRRFNSFEWRRATPVSPVEIIEVKGVDLPRNIKIVECQY